MKKKKGSSRPRWISLGEYEVMGSVCEWHCALFIRKETKGRWSVLWVGEEGAERVHGPAQLPHLLKELVGCYDLSSGEDLIPMFFSARNKDLRHFGESLLNPPRADLR